jgi:hypothetical protein
MKFSDIPSRLNVTRILREWFDNLRDAGVALENFLGAGFISNGTATIANAQATPANVTGLTFDAASVTSAFIDVEIYRNTTGVGATELKETRVFHAIWMPTAAEWLLFDVGGGGGDSGVIISPSTGGTVFQAKYTSTNITGTAATSQIKFKARTFAV